GIARTGLVTIADQVLSITQAGATCIYALSPLTNSHGGGTETGLVTVTTLYGCPWTISNANNWIIFPSTNGTGNTPVSYIVTNNPTLTGRTGIVMIAGRVF